jgi:hypothetical protein
LKDRKGLLLKDKKKNRKMSSPNSLVKSKKTLI